eukprot:Colp12_sorted_trinity150504_noHs@24091
MIQPLTSEGWVSIPNNKETSKGNPRRFCCADHDPTGLLGLQNLVYFMEHYNDRARSILSKASHPVKGFSFAIVGINLTGILVQLLKEGTLRHQAHRISAERGYHYAPTTLHEMYCAAFVRFSDLWWQEDPENMMAFGAIRDKFVANLRQELAGGDVVLHL